MDTKQKLVSRLGWVAAALLLIVTTYLFTSQQAERLQARTPITVTYHDPEGSQSEELVPGGVPSFPDAPAIEGYTFLYWKDNDGQQVVNRKLRLHEDTDYYAVYAMAFDRSGHEAWLPLDEDGSFHPDEQITRREAAELLYRLLGTELVGKGRFTDVDKEDSAYKAVATLKDLGVIGGSRFHPDEVITRYEFLQMLTSFFPAEERNVRFADLEATAEEYPVFRTAAQLNWIDSGKKAEARPHEALTRAELARILCEVLDRRGDQAKREKMAGTILDVPVSDERYWAVAEMSIPHTFRQIGDEEIWVKSKALPLREEGFFFLGTDLHAIDEHGDPVVNGSYAGVSFDGEGVVTSGDPELDRLVRDLLPRLVDPSDMTREEMLETLFIYTLDQLRYRKGNYYPPGEPAGWEIAEAKSALSRKAGNCYSFAAAFCVLARAVGYPAEAYTGSIRTETTPLSNSYTDIHGEEIVLPARRTPHGWVEIEMDGESLIFDPELSFRLFADGSASPFIFKAGAAERRSYAYSTERDDPDPLSPEASPAVAATP